MSENNPLVVSRKYNTSVPKKLSIFLVHAKAKANNIDITEKQDLQWSSFWTIITGRNCVRKGKNELDKMLFMSTRQKEELRSPATNPAVREKDGYQTMTTNIPLFVAINHLPIALDPDRLNESDGIHETFKKNSALYHQPCRLLFNNSKLERARKRSANSDSLALGINDERSKKRRTIVYTKGSVFSMRKM